MYCDKHLNTELMLKSIGEEDGYTVQILYCPNCKQDKYKQLTKENEVIITRP